MRFKKNTQKVQQFLVSSQFAEENIGRMEGYEQMPVIILIISIKIVIFYEPTFEWISETLVVSIGYS